MTRGCGELAHDAVYHHWSLGAGGIPISQMIICPVWTINPVLLGIHDRGITLLERPDMGTDGTASNPDGSMVYDAFDVVGRKYYPYKTDFYEEVKRQGFNRRWPTSVDISKLTPSRSLHYVCTHAGAYDLDTAEAIREEVNSCAGYHRCLKNYDHHRLPFGDRFFESCSAMWWHELPESACVRLGQNSSWSRVTASATYSVHPRKTEPQWVFGVFMAFPIGKFIATTSRGTETLCDRVQAYVDKLLKKDIKVEVVSLDEEDDDGDI